SVLFTALLISFPWWCLTAVMFVYLSLLPIGWRSFQRRTKADLAANSGKSD
ncbi:MAG TPA: CDP-diacylglycerol--serine O-phosphatidyltransferase, partial [Rhizobiales bacterium]|nr:CDP-diacylglycerol--serine O-phosphatidyltransferase [Hyphomicrobiales bacterium]